MPGARGFGDCDFGRTFSVFPFAGNKAGLVGLPPALALGELMVSSADEGDPVDEGSCQHLRRRMLAVVLPQAQSPWGSRSGGVSPGGSAVRGAKQTIQPVQFSQMRGAREARATL